MNDMNEKARISKTIEALQDLLESRMKLIPCSYEGIQTVAIAQETEGALVPTLMLVVPDIEKELLDQSGQRIHYQITDKKVLN